MRLEFGIRNEPWPAVDGTVVPYVDGVTPIGEQLGPSRVRVLDPVRTLWEKATILHLEAHRAARRSDPDRLARHYADLATMVDTPLGEEALARLDLLQHVARHKAAYFRAPRARYDEAEAGRIRLVPSDALCDQLRRDYARMRDMYFREPLEFDVVLSTLAEFERRVHDAATQRDH